MPNSRLAILLGHSHTGSLIQAAAARPTGFGADRDALHFAIHENWKFTGEPPYVTAQPGEADRFNPAVLEAMGKLVAQYGEPTFIAAFGGNGWAVAALMQHSRPIDFILPTHPDLPLDESADLVPFGYIASVLRSLTDKYNYMLYLLRQATSSPIYAPVAPPPIGDDAFVEQRMDDFFKNNQGFSLKPSPKSLRMKMWLLQRQLQAEVCEQNGITLLDVPARAFGPDGFLDPSCYSRDATHANATYGALVLDQVEAALSAQYATYHCFS